jgi:hypothetical protein
MVSMSETSLRNLIRENYVYLLGALDASLYIDLLYQERVLSEDEKGRLSNIRGRKEQAQAFVDNLSLKPEGSILKFFEIVRTATDKQPHIYEKLFPGSRQEQQAKQGLSYLPACLPL